MKQHSSLHYFLFLMLLSLGVVSASSLETPKKVQKNDIISSENWNTVVDTIAALRNKTQTIEATLATKANISDIPNMNHYVTIQQLNAHQPQTSPSCPQGQTLHLCEERRGIMAVGGNGMQTNIYGASPVAAIGGGTFCVPVSNNTSYIPGISYPSTINIANLYAGKSATDYPSGSIPPAYNTGGILGLVCK